MSETKAEKLRAVKRRREAREGLVIAINRAYQHINTQNVATLKLACSWWLMTCSPPRRGDERKPR